MIDVSDALWDICEFERIQVVKKTVQDFELVESVSDRSPIYIEGSLQPMNARELLIKPEGQRSWRWWTLWTTEKLELDWVVIDRNGSHFRIMNSNDWEASGYFQYQLTEGPTP